jgi:hypothetical protein
MWTNTKAHQAKIAKQAAQVQQSQVLSMRATHTWQSLIKYVY